MKKIGPNFFNELKAAGLNGLPLSFAEDGIFYATKLRKGKEVEIISLDDKARVEAVLAAHDPETPDENSYAESRRKELPDRSDLIDAVIKWLARDREVLNLPPELVALIEQIDTVKGKYPKPEKQSKKKG